jgi:hypothetical protein
VRKLRHRGSRNALARLQKAAVRQGQKVRHPPLDDPETVPGQLHVRDDLGIQQADRVAGGRVAKARMELLRHGGPADHRPALQHHNLQSGAGQVEGADKAVMTAADDDDVGLGRHGQA